MARRRATKRLPYTYSVGHFCAANLFDKGVITLKETTNYKLNQWERHDRVLMDDFNADNAKIDAALAMA